MPCFFYIYFFFFYQIDARMSVFFFFQAEDGIRDATVTGSSDVCSSDLRAFPDARCDRPVPAALARAKAAARQGREDLSARRQPVVAAPAAAGADAHLSL